MSISPFLFTAMASEASRRSAAPTAPTRAQLEVGHSRTFRYSTTLDDFFNHLHRYTSPYQSVRRRGVESSFETILPVEVS
nr:MAG TPA: hypothetical protein [Caudoviricetes sp.]